MRMSVAAWETIFIPKQRLSMTLLCKIRQLLRRNVDKRCKMGLFIVGIVENKFLNEILQIVLQWF